ncbi:DUF4350 domain-containing protein [Yaniella flava]|uniref:DUF4350 domain-containing protein n=1 Tax=Yaniella flava TaxID=287930 RepID=A0ABN2U2Z7_9MICC
MNTRPRRKFGLISVVALVVVVWLVIMIWIAVQPQRAGGSLGIDEETGPGAAGITSVLEDQGIAVRPAQTMSQLRNEMEQTPNATVLFHDKNSAMQTASYERLQELTELVPADQRVFAGVSEPQMSHMLNGIDGIQGIPGGVEEVQLDNSCAVDAAREAGTISDVSSGVVVGDNADGCFAVGDEAMAGEHQAYAYAQTAQGSIVFADAQMLSNYGLYENGTATLATWALGQSDTVIWFQPDFTLDADGDGDLSPVQLPDWARMGIVWAIIVTGIGLFFIGRRTGPVITEPLPAEVSTAETTVGRGRMYAQAKHHGHALTMLQQASLARLARLLQLSAQTPPDEILAQTATQLGRPVAELHGLYSPPSDEITSRTFVTWAQHLQDLEHQVRDRFAAPPKESQ